MLGDSCGVLDLADLPYWMAVNAACGDLPARKRYAAAITVAGWHRHARMLMESDPTGPWLEPDLPGDVFWDFNLIFFVNHWTFLRKAAEECVAALDLGFTVEDILTWMPKVWRDQVLVDTTQALPLEGN